MDSDTVIVRIKKLDEILQLRAKFQTAMKLLICALERGDRLIFVTVANGWTPLIIVTKSSV